MKYNFEKVEIINLNNIEFFDFKNNVFRICLIYIFGLN